jgi:hypothetical protein
MNSRLAARLSLIAVLVGLVAPAYGDDPSISDLMKERLAARKAVQAIGNEQRYANSELQAKGTMYSDLYYSLQRPAPTDQEFESLKTQETQTRQREAELKAELAALPTRIEHAQRKVELAAIKDATERANKAKEYQALMQETNKKLTEAGKPYQDRIKAAQEPLAKTQTTFETALNKCFHDGADKYADGKVSKMSWSLDTTTSQIHWQLADKSDAVWCAVFMQEQPFEKPAGPNAKAIDGKYGYSYSATNVWVQVGYFNLSFNINKKEWQGEEPGTMAMIKSLVDLDALAAFKP